MNGCVAEEKKKKGWMDDRVNVASVAATGSCVIYSTTVGQEGIY